MSERLLENIKDMLRGVLIILLEYIVFLKSSLLESLYKNKEALAKSFLPSTLMPSKKSFNTCTRAQWNTALTTPTCKNFYLL